MTIGTPPLFYRKSRRVFPKYDIIMKNINRNSDTNT